MPPFFPFKGVGINRREKNGSVKYCKQYLLFILEREWALGHGNHAFPRNITWIKAKKARSSSSSASLCSALLSSPHAEQDATSCVTFVQQVINWLRPRARLEIDRQPTAFIWKCSKAVTEGLQRRRSLVCVYVHERACVCVWVFIWFTIWEWRLSPQS